jgi:hypothetical protein
MAWIFLLPRSLVKAKVLPLAPAMLVHWPVADWLSQR